MNKVIVIGLDAACLDILLPWVNKGELPYLRELLSNGVYSHLRSTIPPWTAPAWPSLVTGKNPGKHGIFDFFKQRGNHESELVSSTDNKAKTIWDYLSEAGKSAIVINVPITYPARKINGILIPGYMAPENPSCHPPNILQELKAVCGQYKIYSDYETKQVSPEKKLQGYIAVTKLRKDVTLYLAQKYDWDFLMVEFQKTDAVFHNFKEEKYILQFYKFIDQCIGEIIEVLGSANTDIFLVSDHGMGRVKWTFYINSWLRKEGLLETREQKERSNLYMEKKKLMGSEDPSRKSALFNRLMDHLGKMGVSAERINDWLSSLHLDFLKFIVPRSLIHKVPRRAVDQVKSLAYCPSSSSLGIKINSQNSEEYQKLRSQLIEKLKGLKDPEGNPVFEKVLCREEYYLGPCVVNAPDIVFVPREMNYNVSDSISNRLFSPFVGYNHKMNGLFIGIGDNIVSSGYLGSELSIFDVAPTILHIMGLPIPVDMDGRVLKEIFKEGSEAAQREVRHKQVAVEQRRVKSKISDLKRSSKI
jgi:predicted AlkP superfamily phosphohydrolase/phosphomutase